MRTSIPRLRSVRFKAGGNIRLLPREKFDLTDRLARAGANMANTARENRNTVAGFAIVAWGPDGSTWSTCAVGNASAIPSVLVPDLVRNKLLAERIEDWTIEAINGG